ncbi:hypothetical protein ACFPM7_05500 [Actinokineospora guangxiensis]|uniref:Ig-like domain-containing protein n=1 Tax=Actinokineospora guangxiensis TaxID=1490288 RepID=A0ABW0EKQ2_9PSEU
MDIMGARKSVGVAAGILLAVVGAAGCGALESGQGRAAPTSVSTVTVTVPASTTAAAASTGHGSAEGGVTQVTEVAESTAKRAPATTTTARPHVPAGPRIESFTVVSKPTCPVVGTPDAPFSSPGSGVVVAWKVSGAEGAAISVDNPGVYASYGGDYPATGQLELSFPCNGGSGETTHTYTVWPKDAKGVSKTLTVSARNNS